MIGEKQITPALQYFFKRMERRYDEVERARLAELAGKEEIDFEQLNVFFRQIKTQNIFINTVGQNGKRESTILSKAIFSMNRVVRIYYSTSVDDTQSGFIRIRPIQELQMIIVERLHGHRPEPEFMYSSHDQCHIIRFIIRWLLRRIDWNKTRLHNLDLYKRFLLEEEEHAKEQAKIAKALQEKSKVQKTLDEHLRAQQRKELGIDEE